MKDIHPRKIRRVSNVGWPAWATAFAVLLCGAQAAAESRYGALRYPDASERVATAPEMLPQAPRWQTVLKAPAAKELKWPQVSKPGQPIRIGVPRFAPKLGSDVAISERPEWIQRADGSWSITLEVTSVGAKAVRASVALQTFPGGTSVVFFDGAGERLSTTTPAQPTERVGNGLKTATGGSGQLIWSPTSAGATVFADVRLPVGATPGDIQFALGPISHLFVSPFDRDAMMSLEKSSGECNLDVVCYEDYEQLRTAVSRMVYVKNGSSFLCTGQLLSNGSGNAERYYLSANHCISSQVVADTLETWWNFESSSCDADTTSSAQERVVGGADLVTTDAATDSTLLRLRGTLDFPTFYMGWTTDVPATDIFGIHHPAGDLKKISFGEVQGYTKRDVGTSDLLDSSDPDANFIATVWNEGTTEGGSSGSALLDQEERVVGVLFRGTASCSEPEGLDEYGRFDRAFERNSWQAFLALGDDENRITATKAGSGRGTLTSSPAGISCDVDCSTASAGLPAGSSVTVTATAESASTFLGWEAGSCDSNPDPSQCTVTLSDNRTVTASFEANLGPVLTAIDDSGTVTGAELGTSGMVWTVDESTSTVGGSSAVSGDIGDDELSTLSITLEGPGTLSFDWRVSSEEGYDFLGVSLDGGASTRISGEQDWQAAEPIDIPSGQHTVSWTYEKDFSLSEGEDSGWVDNVDYRTGDSGDGSVFFNLLGFLNEVMGRSED